MTAFSNKSSALILTLTLFTSRASTTVQGAAPVQDSSVTSSILNMTASDRVRAITLLKSCDLPTARALLATVTAEASKAHLAGNLGRAAFLYDIGVEAARQVADKKLLLRTLYNLGSVYADARDYDGSERSLIESSKLAEEIGSVSDLAHDLAILGTLYIREAFYAKAKPVSRRLLEISLSLKEANRVEFEYDQAVAYSDLGRIAMWEGDTSLTIECFQKSVNFFAQLDLEFRGRYQAGVLDGYVGMGLAYYNGGEYSRALELYTKALSIAEANNYLDRLAGILISLSLLYTDQGDYAKASDLMARGLKVATERGDREDVVSILNNQALLDQRQGRYEEAARKFSEVLALAEEANRQDLRIPPLEGLGSAYHKLGRYDLALRQFDKAEDIALLHGDKLRQCELNWWKGCVYYDLRDYVRSVEYSMVAAKLADELSEPNLSYLALTQLGKSRIALGQLDSASADLLGAIDRAEQIRGKVGGQEQQRALFFERKIEPYYLMVDLLIQQNKRDQALLFAERARSRTLLDLLGRSTLALGSTISQPEREEEKRLDGQVSALNTQLYRESQQGQPDQGRLADLRLRLDKARIDYDSFLDRLYVSHPEVKVNRGQASLLALDELRKLLPGPDSAVLEFELLEDKVYVFALSVAANGAVQVNSYRVGISPKALAGKVEGFRERIANRGLGVDKLSVELHDLLLAPAAADINGKKTIVVVPDGVLWDLPFQALKSNNRYLIEDHAIFYAPSLTALREMMKRKQGRPGPVLDGQAANGPPAALLAFGNPALSRPLVDQAVTNKSLPSKTTEDNAEVTKRDEALQPLPESEREVQTLAKLYGPDRSRVFIGLDATEDRAKTEMGRFNILHFAAHGILDGTNPLYSHIVLSQAGPSQDDGLLEAREIMNMNLKADLAVLSACQTARGRISTGEGVIGMSWAFFAAGCPTTVVSQWSVESQSTTELMIEFHRNLLSRPGISKAEALRQASLKLLKTEKYRHPFYWAGFIVMGDGR